MSRSSNESRDVRVLPDAVVGLLEPTGFNHPNCYAACGRDECSETISKEHADTHGLLKAIKGKGNVMFVSGDAGQADGERTDISPKRYAWDVLCQRHNTALSQIDEVATNVAKALAAATYDGVSGGGISINGHDWERLILKTLLGRQAAGKLEVDGMTVDTKVNPELVDILFQRKEIPISLGCFFDPRFADGEATTARGFQPFVTPPKVFTACRHTLLGMAQFTLVLNEAGREALGPHAVHWVDIVKFRGDRDFEWRFRWPRRNRKMRRSHERDPSTASVTMGTPENTTADSADVVPSQVDEDSTS